MSTSERINTELTSLQKELGQLKSYTDDIGNARDASANVVKASQQFTSAFQKNISSLVAAMEEGASDFQETCNKSSDQLHKASVRFDADIDRSQKLLDVLGKQLDATATRVVQMTGEIKQMDIPGRFSELNSAVIGLEAKAREAEEKVRIQLEMITAEQVRFAKRTATMVIVSTVLTVIAIALVYLALK